MICSEPSNFRWRQFLLIISYFYDSASTCDWFKVFTPKCLYFRDRFLARAKDYLTNHMFKNAVNIEVAVFSRGVPRTIQFQVLFTFLFKLSCIAKIRICFQVVLLRFTFVSSCIDKHICFQVVLTRLPFVFKLLHVVFTSCIYKLSYTSKFMYQHVRK